MAYLENIRFSILGYLLLLLLGLHQSYAQSYKAGVVAYKVRYNDQDLPSDTIANNIGEYVLKIGEMNNQVDIVVFPEYGITTLKPTSLLRDHLEPYSIDVPDPDSGPDFKENILARISSAARSSKIYVVINVSEKSNSGNNATRYYSTDVVFDSNGKLIAKCRKKYLYLEKDYDAGEINQKCTFEANFKTGVRTKFALLFDADILANRPDASINDAILTSALPNQLPLSFGLSLHVGYSVRNRINLLASGYVDATRGYAGTGIYLKNGTSRVTLSSDSFFYEEVPAQKVVAETINVKVKGPVQSDILENVPYTNICTLGTTNTINTTTSLHFNDGASYCRFEATFGRLIMEEGENNLYPYKWLALNATKHLMGQRKHFIICALVDPIQTGEHKMVNDITVVAASRKENIIQILPISLALRSDNTYVPANFQYKEENNDLGVTVTTMKLNKRDDLLVFGVLFILKSAVSHSISIHVSHLSFVGSLCVIMCMWSKYYI